GALAQLNEARIAPGFAAHLLRATAFVSAPLANPCRSRWMSRIKGGDSRTCFHKLEAHRDELGRTHHDFLRLLGVEIARQDESKVSLLPGDHLQNALRHVSVAVRPRFRSIKEEHLDPCSRPL